MNNFFKLIAISVLTCCFFLCSCSAVPKQETKSFFAMDTYITITAYGENCSEAVEESRQIITELENKWSVTNENSEIYKINSSTGTVKISDETAELISFARNISLKTDGALDLTVYPIMKLWGFTGDEYRVPEKEEISKALKYVGNNRIAISGNEITLKSGTMLDLGAVAKGYASDKISDRMKSLGIDSALINLGGNIMLVGANPDGNDWAIGLKDPSGEGNLGIISASDCSIVTSGNYERYFTAEGKKYGHIINPDSGYPVDNDLLSVTIISESSTLGDALSTALFVKGFDGAVSYYKENKNDFEMILAAKSGEIYITPGVSFKTETDEITVNIID